MNTHLIQLKSLSTIRGAFYLIIFCACVNLKISAQPVLTIKDTKKNFGFVKKGEIIKINYEFTNTGNSPLIIQDSKVECSCTTVELPKQPIAPNTTNTITVSFDTKSVYDRQDRTVEIRSNAKNNIQKIRFKGVVLTK